MSKKIDYYLKRISRSSLPELIYRLDWKLRSELVDRFYHSSRPARYSLTREEFKSFISKRLQFGYIKKDIKKADNILQGRIKVYEIDKHVKDIDWNKDYKTGKVWPKKFYMDYHHDSTEHGFVRYVWELNRFNHLLSVGKAYVITKDKKYAEFILGQIGSWIEQNPHLDSINWFSGLELSVRVLNWITALICIRDYLSYERACPIFDSISSQLNAVKRHISKYSSANNHLIGELAGLAALDKDKYLRKLEKEVLKQTYLDGTGKEQSTNYLVFILELLCLVYAITKEKPDAKIKERLKACSNFIISISYHRSFPEIGDSDYATLGDLVEHDKRHISLVNQISALTGIKTPFELDEKTVFLFGDKIDKKKIDVKSGLFSKGGYLVSLSDDTSLILDCGPLGYLSTAGHGHCDALSFILSVDKKDFFTDPGTYVYHGNPKWRDYFRGTSAHNTISIDGKDQSKILGTFMYSDKARCKVLESRLAKDTDSITAYHDGYRKLGATHVRKLVHDKQKKKIIIKDKILSKEKHKVSLFFSLHPDVKVGKKRDKLVLARDNTMITLKLDPKLKIKIYNGSNSPIRGWYSPYFGIKLPCYCIEASSSKEKEFKTSISY